MREKRSTPAAAVGTVSNAGETYNVYNAGLFAQLLVDTDVTPLVI